MFGNAERFGRTHDKRTETHACDLIDRREAIEAIKNLPRWVMDANGEFQPVDSSTVSMLDPEDAVSAIENLPSVQPEIIRCKDCIYYDPPHVENNGVRYEYDEMPADAFDALGTGLVNAEYGINIG